MVSPRVAAKASAISSSENCRRARCVHLLGARSAGRGPASCWPGRRPAATGSGRTSAKAVSMTKSVPSRTIRFAGLMSRWARPTSHIRRTTDSPWSMTASSMSASPISTAPSKNSVTSRYSRSGVISTIPMRVRPRAARRRHEHAQDVVLVLDQPADAVEGLLVLQPAVEQGAAELVPAVGAHVRGRVELAEDVGVRVALDGDPQRRRPARPGQPERLRRRWRSARAGPAGPG